MLTQFNVDLRPQKPQGLLGSGSPGGHLDFHIAPELGVCSMLLYVHGDRTDYKIRDREPRTATTTFTQLLNSVSLQCCFAPTCRDRTDYKIRGGEPRNCVKVEVAVLGFPS